MRLKFVIDEDKDITMARQRGHSDETITRMKKGYDMMGGYLDRSRELYRNSWDEINDNFSDYVEKVTGYKWFYPEYGCVVSLMHKGISNWGHEPLIYRIWNEGPYAMRRITAHELILSHYFEIYRRRYGDRGLTDGQVWALAEIAAFALTSLTPEASKFWPWGAEYYTNHNYPHIVELQNELRWAFLNRKSFDEYIAKGIELVRKYPGMNPKGI